MANTSSPNITLLEATPNGIAQRQLSGSDQVLEKGTVEFTPTAADTCTIARVPVTATLDELKFAFDDNGGTITLDIGFYQVPEIGGTTPGTVIDQNALATLIDTSTAALAMAEYRFETQEINTISEEMWELANLSARPSYPQMDIVITGVTGTTPAAGTISWYIKYTK